MKSIRNLTRRPLKLPLPRGKVLHLGPGKTGQIADDAAEHPPLAKLIEDKQLEILGHSASGPLSGSGGGNQAHGATQGHAPASGASAPRRGDRGV